MDARGAVTVLVIILLYYSRLVILTNRVYHSFFPKVGVGKTKSKMMVGPKC